MPLLFLEFNQCYVPVVNRKHPACIKKTITTKCIQAKLQTKEIYEKVFTVLNKRCIIHVSLNWIMLLLINSTEPHQILIFWNYCLRWIKKTDLIDLKKPENWPYVRFVYFGFSQLILNSILAQTHTNFTTNSLSLHTRNTGTPATSPPASVVRHLIVLFFCIYSEVLRTRLHV